MSVARAFGGRELTLACDDCGEVFGTYGGDDCRPRAARPAVVKIFLCSSASSQTAEKEKER